jgi:hypothetical protein
VVPFADSEGLVRNSGLPVYTLIEVGNDHRLDDAESLETMLEACLVDDEEDTAEEEEEDILERDHVGTVETRACGGLGPGQRGEESAACSGLRRPKFPR